MAGCDERQNQPGMTRARAVWQGCVALLYFGARVLFQLCRSRATVTMHAIGVPMATPGKPHKGTLPVNRDVTNALTREFLLVKGVRRGA